jgi:hypothetical protein
LHTRHSSGILPAYRVNHGRDVVWLLVGNVLDGLHRAWHGSAGSVIKCQSTADADRTTKRDCVGANVTCIPGPLPVGVPSTTFHPEYSTVLRLMYTSFQLWKFHTWPCNAQHVPLLENIRISRP